MTEQTLPPEAFRRMDNSLDDLFYQTPRLVTHIDNAAIRAVTQLYREHFPTQGAIFDLMSSWISHLPENVHFDRVVGHGMNRQELAANPRLTEFFVQNLNESTSLPLADQAFDGAGCCVSVQYLVHPVAVFQEVGRILKPGAPFIVSFSNRCFPTKAVAVWQQLDDRGHVGLVEYYFAQSGCFQDVTVHAWQPKRGDPLFAVVGKASHEQSSSVVE